MIGRETCYAQYSHVAQRIADLKRQREGRIIHEHVPFYKAGKS